MTTDSTELITGPELTTGAIAEVEARVIALATGGWCVAEVVRVPPGGESYLGMKIFVAKVVPGEEVVVAIQKRKDRFLEGELLRVLQASPLRVAPPCEYYALCGGCQLQHIAQEAHGGLKLDMMTSAMRAGKLSDDTVACVEPLRVFSPFAYRRRLALGVKRNGKVGLHKRRSYEVVPIRKCLIATGVINDYLARLDLLDGGLEGLRGTLHLEADESRALAILRLERELMPERVGSLVALLQRVFPSARIEACGKTVAAYGDQSLTLSLAASDDLTLEVPGASFSQTNWEVNRDLVATAIEYAVQHQVSSAHDICAGAGNFAIPLALRGIRTTAVECDRSLVALGSAQAKSFNLEGKLTFVRSSMEKFFEKYPQDQRVDLIIADPPRSGLGEMCSKVGYADRLILVSCYLPSFVRDVGILQREGWVVRRIIPFEMFPQTTHLEIMTILERPQAMLS